MTNASRVVAGPAGFGIERCGVVGKGWGGGEEGGVAAWELVLFSLLSCYGSVDPRRIMC
jgi:hypothetical protein